MQQSKPFLPLYFFLCLLLACLVGRNFLPHTIGYALLACFILIAAIYHQYWRYLGNIKQLFSQNIFFTILSTFVLYSTISSVFGHAPLYSIPQALGLGLVLCFIRFEIDNIDQKGSNCIIQGLFYVGAIFTTATWLGILLFPHMLLNQHVYTYSPHALRGLEGQSSINAQILLNIVVITLLTHQLNINKKISVYIVLAATTVLILLSNVRTDLFVCLPLIIFSFILYNHKRISTNLLIAIILIAIMSLIICLFFIPPLHQYFYRYNQHYNFFFNLEGRSEIWKTSLVYLFRHNWLSGVGLGNQYVIIHANGYAYNKSHNSFLDVLLGTGVIGFLIYLSAILYSLIHTLCLYIKSKSKFCLLSLCCLLGLIASSMTDSTLNSQLSTSYFLYLFIYFFNLKLHQLIYNKSD